MAHSADGSPRRARRSQIPAAIARQRVLDAGVAYIERNGLTVDIGPVPLEEIIVDADVPRATVYRHWRSQSAYVADLIAELFARPEFQLNFSSVTSASIADTLQRHAALLDTAAGRRAVLREVIRIAAEQNLREVLVSPPWHAYNALYAAAGAGGDPALATTARSIEQHFINANAVIYQRVLETMGLRMRPPHTARTIAVAANVVVSGFANRIHVDPSLADLYLDGPALDGTTTRWHVVASLARAAIEPLIEDPDHG